MFDWHDLQHFLAVHREGSLSRAGSRLKVDPTTVGRRVGALEHALGQPLFVRAREGWTITPFGERVLPAAERAEEAARDVQKATAAEEKEPVGRVRLTTLDVLASRVIAPVLPRLHARYPRLRLDVLCTPISLDLLRGEADVALRAARPVESSLLARRVASATEHLYVARRFLTERGLQPDLQRIDGLPALVNYTDESWAMEAGAHLALRTSSGNMLIEAVAAGGGVAFLPDVVVARDPRLVRLTGMAQSRERPLWLVVQRELARVSRVRAVTDFLVEVLQKPSPEPLATRRSQRSP